MQRSSIPKSLDEKVRAAARNRCGYCLSPQHLVMARLEIEHIIPKSRGGTSSEDNLWLSCPLCNNAKRDRTSAVDPISGTESLLFNPRTQKWTDHFRWSKDGLRIEGLSPTGRATVSLLQLDSDTDMLLVRSYWIQAGWHPPGDVE